jgi:hypothetical protein
MQISSFVTAAQVPIMIHLFRNHTLHDLRPSSMPSNVFYKIPSTFSAINIITKTDIVITGTATRKQVKLSLYQAVDAPTFSRQSAHRWR